uniref:Death domain-containing protein n=1 Tax=Graphocephala atropunctata TaxID=36148 RepID=A0A1B6MJR1_9HEMI
MFRNRNPVLETKRDGYLEAEREKRDKLLDVYKLSVSKTKHLHTNLLFTTYHGRAILSDICRHVTFVEPSVMNNSWRDLAVRLGYSDVEVKCINNLRGSVYDPTEALLQYYAATKTEGTVGFILEVLLELGFLPALHKVQKHIDLLLTELETKEADIIEVPNSTEDLEAKSIIKAANFKPCIPAIFDVPQSKDIAIKVVNCTNNNNNNNTVQHEVLHKARPQTVQRKQYCRYVMLSFASDGYATAVKVAAALRATTNRNGFPIGVVMLCENDDIVMRNPGQMITEIVTKMDFVIPVLTDGYFAALKFPNSRARLVDERYVQFIHDILVSKYIHSQCVSNVRPVIPSSAVSSVHARPEFVHNSIFHAWRSEDELQALAKGIVKSHKSRVLPQ